MIILNNIYILLAVYDKYFVNNNQILMFSKKIYFNFSILFQNF